MNHIPRTYWQTGAVFSPCPKCDWLERCACALLDESMSNRPYRYRLHRTWADGPHLMIVGLNPSTATETRDDNTIRRCIAYAQDWGFAGLVMMNAFAYRSTDPKGLLGAPDPVGPDNDFFLVANAKKAGRVVLAWGSKSSPRALHKLVQTRGKMVMEMLRPVAREIGRLGELNADGSPQHPLMQPKTAAFVAMEIT